MGQKTFYWNGGTTGSLENRRYTDGNLIEATLRDAPIYVIFAWHNISQGDRNAIIAKLGSNWTEGEET